MTKTATPIRLPAAPLAWIGDSTAPPRALAATAVRYEDSDDFLLSPQAFEHDFYVVQLVQRGVCGIDLIRLIRRRSTAGIVALCNEAQDDFVEALDAGADMVLGHGAPPAHLGAAIAAVRRRAGLAAAAAASAASAAPSPWTLHEAHSQLQAPDGTVIALSDSDLTIMRCFAAAGGAQVARQVLVERLWGEAAGAMDNALHATVYRLRKRIEQAGQALVPVHAVSRVGYEFRAPLVSA